MPYETENWRVRLAAPPDLPAIRSLLLRSYGDTYPFPDRLDPTVMLRSMQGGTAVLGVAETVDGSIVGHATLDRRNAFGLWEYDRAIVERELRGTGILAALGKLLVLEQGRAVGARFVMGQVVTSHPYAQRFGRSLGFVATGLLLGCVPETMVVAGVAPPAQPISELVMALRIEKDEPARVVTLLGRDRDRVEAALASLELETASRRGRSGTLGAHFERNGPFGLVHLRFGANAPPRRLHPGFTEGLEAAGTRVLWADVPIDHADAPRVIDQLRLLGLGYSAYVPAAGVHGEDVVRFQRYLDTRPLRPEAIHVIEDAHTVAEDVFAECLAMEATAAA